MADIGSATVRVTPNMTGIQSKIAAGFKGSAGPATAALGDEVEKNSGPFQNALGKLGGFAKGAGIAIAAGIGVGVAGLAALTKKSLMAGAELEQQLGGAEAVFGEFADSIKQSAEDAYSKAGLSQNEFLQGANRMGSLFQGAGFSVQASMKMTQESMQRASDIASIMGISTTSALEAITGMAKGNFTMMDNLGVAMNDTAIGAYALEKGINKSTAAMSIQEKVGLAQQMFLEKTAKYAGNYAKENDTLAGSLNSTKKAFDNLMSGQGDISGFIELLVNTIEIAVPQIIAILPKLVQGIGAILKAVVPALAKALPTLVPALIDAVQGLLNALIAALPSIIKTLVQALPMFIKAFIQLFLAFVQALPQIIQIISQSMPQIIDAIVVGLTAPEALTAIIMGTVQLMLAMIQAIPIIISALVAAIPTIIKNIVATLTSPQFLQALGNAGVQLMSALVSGIGRMIGAVASAAWNVIHTIASVLTPSSLFNIGKNLIQGLINGAASLLSNIGKFFLDKVPGWIQGPFKKALGISSPSKVFAGYGQSIAQGLAKGVSNNAGLVQRSVNDMANTAMAGMADYGINPSVAFGGGAAAGAAGNSSTTNQSVSIQKIVLGDESAVKEFFKQLNQNVVTVGMGLTPTEGATP